MLVKAEIFIEMADSASEPDNMWEALRTLSILFNKEREEGGLKVLKIRLPDSPEPDITGTLYLGT